MKFTTWTIDTSSDRCTILQTDADDTATANAAQVIGCPLQGSDKRKGVIRLDTASSSSSGGCLHMSLNDKDKFLELICNINHVYVDYKPPSRRDYERLYMMW